MNTALHQRINRLEQLALARRVGRGLDFLLLGGAGLDWTPWIPLSASLADMRTVIPKIAGFYRIRVTGRNELAYIGQTGRELRERIRSLALRVVRISTPASK
jgi:hypothetical protein